MKTLQNFFSRTMLVVGLICWLCFFLPEAEAQEHGDLRNNPNTKALEIYVDVILSVDWDTTKTGDYYYYKENKLTKWCNVDSLYEKHGDTFSYYLGSLDLSYIRYQRKIFDLFMEEMKGKK